MVNWWGEIFGQQWVKLSRSNMKMPFTTAETLRAWLLSALVVHGAVGGNPDAKRLYDDLLSNYNKLVRPVVNTSDVLKVCIKLKLSQLIDVVSHVAIYFPLIIVIRTIKGLWKMIGWFRPASPVRHPSGVRAK